jgi:hypothetical protein
VHAPKTHKTAKIAVCVFSQIGLISNNVSNLSPFRHFRKNARLPQSVKKISLFVHSFSRQELGATVTTKAIFFAPVSRPSSAKAEFRQ